MRKIDELVIRGKPEAMAQFKARLQAASDGDWAYRYAVAGRPVPQEWMRPMIVFRSRESPGRRAVKTWLSEERTDEFRLGGTLADDSERMSDEEHNIAIGSFAEFLDSSAIGLDVEVVRIPFRVKMENLVSFEAMRRLRSFAEMPDKTHLDRSDLTRWRRFVTRVYLDSSAIYPEELDGWLEAEGYPEEIRQALLEFYDSALVLLGEYDEERVPS